MDEAYKRLRIAENAIEKEGNVPFEETLGRLSSKNSMTRLTGILQIGKELDRRFNSKLLRLIANHLVDKDENCRWQSAIIISQHMENDLQYVWELILSHGNSEIESIRVMIGVTILEDYFSFYTKDFDKDFEELKRAIEENRPNLKETLRYCYPVFGSDRNNSLVKRYLGEKNWDNGT